MTYLLVCFARVYRKIHLQPEMARKSEEGGARQLQAEVLMSSWEIQVLLQCWMEFIITLCRTILSAFCLFLPPDSTHRFWECCTCGVCSSPHTGYPLLQTEPLHPHVQGQPPLARSKVNMTSKHGQKQPIWSLPRTFGSVQIVQNRSIVGYL